MSGLPSCFPDLTCNSKPPPSSFAFSALACNTAETASLPSDGPLLERELVSPQFLALRPFSLGLPFYLVLFGGLPFVIFFLNDCSGFFPGAPPDSAFEGMCLVKPFYGCFSSNTCGGLAIVDPCFDRAVEFPLFFGVAFFLISGRALNYVSVRHFILCPPGFCRKGPRLLALSFRLLLLLFDGLRACAFLAMPNPIFM